MIICGDANGHELIQQCFQLTLNDNHRAEQTRLSNRGIKVRPQKAFERWAAAGL
jgi:hypothetical protein